MTISLSVSASEIEPLKIEGDSKEFYYECNACHRRFITFVAIENHLLYNHSGNDFVGYLKKRLAEL
jgi:hypothetical protein